MQESGEMYLENILILSKKLENVRAIDIADRMNYSKPSVSRAVSILKGDKYINVDPNGYITLTKKGRAVAEKIYERHIVLTNLLESLGVSAQTAADDACKIEHDLSDETFDAIKRHLNEYGGSDGK